MATIKQQTNEQINFYWCYATCTFSAYAFLVVDMQFVAYVRATVITAGKCCDHLAALCSIFNLTIFYAMIDI